MKAKPKNAAFRSLLAMLCTLAVVPGDTLAYMVSPQAKQAPPSKDQAAKIAPDQLDSLVAPIALYPDPLLAQTLAASTYPLEIVQLQQWLQKNKDLKDKALADAVAKQPWDPSIQAMAALPDVVKRLADDIQWTTNLGNAFLVQQSDVMDAVQRMRKKARDKGNLKSTEQQKVETKVIESKSVIVVEQANPQVMYLPTIPLWCTGRRFIPILPFTIRPQGTTPREWRFLSVWVWPWGRPGAVVGGGALAGEATTISPLIATTISTATRTLAVETAAEIQATIGSTSPHIEAALRTGIERPRTSLAARHVGTP